MRRSVQATLSRSYRQSTQPWPRYFQSQQRCYAAKPSLPTVELCPEPSCECRPTPEGLDIDYKSQMVNPHYDEHVIISTGTSDWSSRLNEDGETGAAYEALRFFLNVTNKPNGGRRFGEFYNPAHSVMISNSSFQPTLNTHGIPYARTGGNSDWERRPERLSPKPDNADGGSTIQTQKHKVLSIPRLDTQSTSVESRTFLPPTARAPKTPTSLYTFPSGKYVTIPVVDDAQTYYSYIRRFIKNFVATKNVHPELAEIAALAGDTKIAEHLERGQEFHLEQSYVMDVVILVCGHGNRDARCGIMGPLLQAEFEDKLPNFNVKVVEGKNGKIPRQKRAQEATALSPKQLKAQQHKATPTTARVGLISHIGGHKWAGNVIIYFPKYYKGHPNENHPLKGKGIWYGRVEPWHVEGIIEQTILEGRVIRELFRGGMPGVRLNKEGALEVEQDGGYDPNEPDALSVIEHMR